jgi:hypothetical protein
MNPVSDCPARRSLERTHFTICDRNDWNILLLAE